MLWLRFIILIFIYLYYIKKYLFSENMVVEPVDFYQMPPEDILKYLPGKNCGGCGKDSCEDFAGALSKGEAKITECPEIGLKLKKRMERSATKIETTARAKTASPGKPSPARLSSGMACDTAFRIIAHRHLDDVIALRERTRSGDPDALHQIRIALTRLRVTIRFFSPMVDDAVRRQVWTDLKWLNSQFGMVRDLDVAVERITAAGDDNLVSIAQLRSWNEKRSESHHLLARALESARYRRLIERISNWIESGPWATRRSKEAIRSRSCPLANHAAHLLAQWEKNLLKKSHKLYELGAKERHRLRLLNKRLSYAIESLEELFADKSAAKQKAALKPLRKAQRCLGQLNDARSGLALAESLNRDGSKSRFRFSNRKREKQLLQTAAAAYKKLDKSRPFRASNLVVRF